MRSFTKLKMIIRQVQLFTIEENEIINPHVKSNRILVEALQVFSAILNFPELIFITALSIDFSFC